jgi:hypothetical protein
MNNSEREEMIKRITEAWRQGYVAGMEDCHDEAEQAGCGEKISTAKAILGRLRHPIHGADNADR